MSFWLEMHCDFKLDFVDETTWNPTARGWDRCWKDFNHGPACLSGSKVPDLLFAKKALERWAREAGWRRTRDHGWLCPFCVKHREKREAPK